MHPDTREADIVAGVRGAYRLLGGKTVKDFLGSSVSQIELAEKLATAEAKIEVAVEYCNELKLEIQRLETELARVKPASTPPILPRWSDGWRAVIVAFSFVALIAGGLTAAALCSTPRAAVSHSVNSAATAVQPVTTDQPVIVYTPRPGWKNAQGQPCREYRTLRSPGDDFGHYGTACQDAAGQWRTENQPSDMEWYCNRPLATPALVRECLEPRGKAR